MATKTAPAADASASGYTTAGTLTFLAAHQADLARRRAEHEANREVLEKCLDPAFAAECEMKKPAYHWTVTASWKAPDKKGRLQDHNAEATVIAQDENTAWALFCDKSGCSRGRSVAKHTIRQGKQVPVETVFATQASVPYHEDT